MLLWTNEVLETHLCVCVRLKERKSYFRAVSYSCFRVCFCCYSWVMPKEIPVSHRDAHAHCHLQWTVIACQLCFISPSCFLPQNHLSTNDHDSISSVVTPGYSQSIMRDYCMALALLTSVCNLKLTPSHLAFMARPAQKMLCLITNTQSI